MPCALPSPAMLAGWIGQAAGSVHPQASSAGEARQSSWAGRSIRSFAMIVRPALGSGYNAGPGPSRAGWWRPPAWHGVDSGWVGIAVIARRMTVVEYDKVAGVPLLGNSDEQRVQGD
jgi:hypothetical protein